MFSLLIQVKFFFDGELAAIIEQFSSEKLLSLEFSSPVERAHLERFGQLEAYSPLFAKLRVPRQAISKSSAEILSSLPVTDLNIEEVPIEDIIRTIFAPKTVS